ncbi:dynamin family protein [Goodfellowiella coeruleoviolacea]|uniref:Dynamin family protein n=1 Tax=Goodfellowiella coeruleoviolacea TaxID=334858 RepID=A0AAE3KH96_9PSEU|nr:dynamin family protein [Goodfellowiella coeruleoviolacea]MCP2166234.1 Dynamin family protein [Goodfellowiella coeruleoviolacea]
MTTALPLAQLVRQTGDRLTGLLREADPQAAEWVAQVRQQRPDTPTVVVVGETNRGKSSLVNALLATPGLSPVDAEVATASYLVLRHGPEWAARACYPGREPVPFPVTELVHWISASHELPAGQLPPGHVEVEAPNPLLTRLSLVDTPGVGGLDSVHGELAMRAAAGATALLFVVDASAPLTRGELAFLQRVGERVETVLFALTKTDHYRGWRQVLEADQALLAEHAPRFADARFLPVSARMFEMAAKAPSPEAAAMLRERSGVAELQTLLQEQVTGRAAMLGEANVLRALDTALAGLAARLEGERRALTTGEDEAASLRARKEELASQRRSSTRGWQVRLRGEVQRARLETSHEVGRHMRDMQAWFRQAIDAADRDALAGLPQQVDAALHLVSGQVSAGLTERLGRVAEAGLADLFSAEELAVIRSQFARAGQPPIVLRPPERRPATAEDKLLVFMGLSGGMGLGRIATLPLAGLGVAALNPIVLPVTIVLGLGAGWWMARTRKHSADKQHMKQWLSDAIADARSTLDQLVSEQLIDAEQQLMLALDEALGKRIEAIEAELREVDRAMKMEAGERNREAQSVVKRLAEVRSGREKIDQLLGRIRGVRDRA